MVGEVGSPYKLCLIRTLPAHFHVGYSLIHVCMIRVITMTRIVVIRYPKGFPYYIINLVTKIHFVLARRDSRYRTTRRKQH